MTFTLRQGDDEDIDFAVTDPANNNEPVDLTGVDEIWIYAKRSTKDADADALISKKLSDVSPSITITDMPGGLLTLHLAPADTRDIPERHLDSDLIFEAQIKDQAGRIITVFRDELIVQADAVHATS